jgi:murein DD-endopeptidase MepM/ murein hydrolase activator NlpD
MSPCTDPARRLISNGVKIKKYFHPIKLSLTLFNRVKKIKESQRDPFSFMRVIAITLFIIFSIVPFLNTFYRVNENSLCLSEDFSFLAASPEIFSENLSQDHFLSSADGFLVGSPNLLLIGESSLRAATPPAMISTQVLGALVASHDFEGEEKAIREYIVESGDTLSSLAAQFDISLDTILWANGLTKKSALKIGQKLVVPPVSGVIHHVKSGDTVSEVARTYKGKTSEIVAFNDLSDENDIYIGDILMVPDGVMPSPSAKSIAAQTPISSVYFIAPTKGMISQGLHWYNAVDFSNPCGALVFAAAQGTVQRIGYGWNDGYGNYLTILHPNGVVTLYAHLSEISVSSGTDVSQGTIIGRIGNTGHTVGATGCHVHFEVRGAQNPFAGYRLGSQF